MPNKTLKIKEKKLLYVSRHKEHKSFSNHEREKKKSVLYKNIKSYYTFADVDIFFLLSMIFFLLFFSDDAMKIICANANGQMNEYASYNFIGFSL